MTIELVLLILVALVALECQDAAVNMRNAYKKLQLAADTLYYAARKG